VVWRVERLARWLVIRQPEACLRSDWVLDLSGSLRGYHLQKMWMEPHTVVLEAKTCLGKEMVAA